MLTIKIKEIKETEHYEKDSVSLMELSRKYQPLYENSIVLAYVDGRLTELGKNLTQDCEVSFVTTKDSIGQLTYCRSAMFLMLKAMKDITAEVDNNVKISINYSINHALFCELKSDKISIDQKLMDDAKKRMQELVAQDIPIMKQNLDTSKVIEMFHDLGLEDKVQLFRYRRGSKTNIYSLEGYSDYFYGYMVPSTGYIKYFDLMPYENGFLLCIPTRATPKKVPEFNPQPKLFNVLKQAEKWGDMLGVGTVGALNDLISKGDMNELILVQEALMEKNIGNIANQIAQKHKKIVLIAGPSSSGKTTFSHRLSIQLRANGLHPHPIAMDNYFVERELTPLDEEGNYNFESIDAIDIKQFNEDMQNLIKGKTVEMPTFNFKLGKREYKGNTKTLGPDDVLVIEGIHGLNPKMSESLDSNDKYKIYISALTQLNIDEHNRIPTTDGRLIRRIVRDAKHRGTSAEDTIAMWHSVRRGEEENIFPYQENADAMFNSALIYEQAVLKAYAEPLLFAIPQDSEQYQEAKRLLKFFEYFLAVDSEKIPNNSIIREFIGGSCFNV